MAVSYKWTSWVREITGWSSRLQENHQSFKTNQSTQEYTSKQRKEKTGDVNMVTGRIQNQQELDRLCPKTSWRVFHGNSWPLEIFTLCLAEGSPTHVILWPMYLQPISLDSQQSLAIHSIPQHLDFNGHSVKRPFIYPPPTLSLSIADSLVSGEIGRSYRTLYKFFVHSFSFLSLLTYLPAYLAAPSLSLDLVSTSHGDSTP
jgi:hypothetical protein